MGCLQGGRAAVPRSAYQLGRSCLGKDMRRSWGAGCGAQASASVLATRFFHVAPNLLLKRPCLQPPSHHLWIINGPRFLVAWRAVFKAHRPEGAGAHLGRNPEEAATKLRAPSFVPLRSRPYPSPADPFLGMCRSVNFELPKPSRIPKSSIFGPQIPCIMVLTKTI